MAYFKEIVTKAIIGKGKKTTNVEHIIDTDDNINTILGCWVINHLITVGDKHLKSPYMTRA